MSWRMQTWLAVTCLVASTTTAGGADPYSLSLLDDDTLAGWTAGPVQPHGWTIAKGQLTGTAPASDLLSSWTFADFELSMQWSVENGGRWELRMPKSPEGVSWSLHFTEGDGCGRLEADGALVAAGFRLESRPKHRAVLTRSGGRLSLECDGKHRYTVDLPADVRVGLELAAEKGSFNLWELEIEEPVGQPIFNGENLDGWWTPGSLASWQVRSGEIVCVNQGGNYLRTRDQFGNFTLSFEYKQQRGGNSGVGIRTHPRGWPSGDGMELQLYDEPPGTPLSRQSSMALYGNMEPLGRGDRSSRWNRTVIKVEGGMVSGWVNGVLAQCADTSRLPELQYRHRAGWIGFQDHGDWIRIRNVHVLPIPPGHGLAAWSASRPETASQRVLDRLMNTRRLAEAERMATEISAVRVTRGSPTVLLDTAGPGAVVRISLAGSEGRVAIYVDGSEQPRVECPAGELAQFLPLVGEDAQPLFTFLQFATRIKVVLTEGTPGDCRVDVVRSGSAGQAEIERDGEWAIARGYLPALSYRYHQLQHGTVRDSDPLPRAASGAKAIEAGSRLPLVSIDGAGVVQWTRLEVDPPAMASDDLWLEVAVDGEARPALAAPARYFFPGLTAQNNYPNLYGTYREGFVSLLAMPYGNGLTITALNQGTKPIAAVGVTVSYSEAGPRTQAAIDGGLRLRGVWQPAGGDVYFNQTGSGRWIGWVVGQSANECANVASLVVDGKPVPGWEDATMSSLIGLSTGEPEGRKCLSGSFAGLSWRWLLAEAVDFDELLLVTSSGTPSARLGLFYSTKGD
jgi:hypothetical protein